MQDAGIGWIAGKILGVGPDNIFAFFSHHRGVKRSAAFV
jgi:hypothetical protein